MEVDITPGGTGEGGTETTELPSMADIIPADYKEKGWVKELPDIPAFFKSYEDNKTALSGRASGIPEDNASDDDWKKFGKAWGVPESPDGYEMKMGEGNEELQKSMRSMLHDAGISKRQLGKMDAGLEKIAAEFGDDPAKAKEARDAEFLKLAETTFGDRQDTVIKRTKAMMELHAPEEYKGHLSEMDNKNVLLLAGVVDSMIEKYVSEDELPAILQGGVGAPGKMTSEERRKLSSEIQNSDAFKNAFDPGHDAAMEKWNKLYQK